MKIFLILFLIIIPGVIYSDVDSRYDAGLNLPFNYKNGEVNPQSGNVTVTATDLSLTGRGGFSFNFSRVWNLTSSNIFSMDLNPQTGMNRLSSRTIEAVERMGVGWSSSIPYLKKEIGIDGEVMHLFFNGSVYQVNLGSINSYNPKESNLMGYDLLNKRIYSGFIGSEISYDDFLEYPLPSGFEDAKERSKYVLILSDNSKYYFNSKGKLMMEVDPSGINMNWYFYNEDKLKVVIDSVGREINFDYDANGNLSEVSYNIDIWQKSDEGERALSREKRSVKYSYKGCNDNELVTSQKDKVIGYREPFKLVGVTNPLGELTEYDYTLGSGDFSFDGVYTKTNLYLLLSSILNNCYKEGDEKKFSSGRFYEYRQTTRGKHKKFFYRGFIEHYKVSRTYLKTIEGKIIQDSYYTYFKDGENGNYNSYSTRVQRGGLIENYHYSLSDSPSLLNVLTSIKRETHDGFSEETLYFYDNVKKKILEEVFRGPKIYEEKFFYDEKGNLTEHINRRGLVTKKQYHPLFSLPVKEYRIFSNQVYEKEWIIDDFGRMKKSILFEKNDSEVRPIVIKDISYDKYGNPIAIKDPLGITHIAYDPTTNSQGVYTWREVTVDKFNDWHSSLGVEKVVTRMESRKLYNSDGSIYLEMDGKGNGKEFFYDKLGRVIETVYPDDNDNTKWYENIPSSTTDLKSIEGLNSFLESRKDNPRERIGIFDRIAKIETTKDLDLSRGKTVSSAIDYDGLGNPLREYSVDGVTTKSYDSYGRMTSLTDPDASDRYTIISVNGYNIKKHDKTWVIKYDDLGREVKIQYPSTSLSTDIKYISYDDRENSVTAIDPLGRTTTSWSDWSGNNVKTINYGLSRDDNNRVYTYDYDELGRKVEFTDPSGIITRYKYNERDLLIEVSYGGSGSDYFTYNDSGLLIEKVDRKSNRIATSYNENGDPIVTSRYYKEGNSEELDEKTHLSYNKLGQVFRIEGKNLIELKTYDSRGREKSLSRHLKSRSLRDSFGKALPLENHSYTFNYIYFDNDSLKSMEYPDGSIINYNYKDNTGLLNSINYGDSPFVNNIKYNNSGVVTSITWENGVSQNWEFDNRKRISRISLERSNQNIEDFRYYLNSIGDIEKINSNEFKYSKFGELESSKILIPGEIDKLPHVEENFGMFGLTPGDYNLDHRINGLDHHIAFLNDIKIGTYDKEIFTYDDSGNRLSLEHNGDLYTYTYGERNRLLEIKKNGSRYRTFKYDLNGNTIEKAEYGADDIKVTTFNYDTLNRLVSTTMNGVTTSYYYDNSNNRILKDTGKDKSLYLRHGDLSVAMDIILRGYNDEAEVNLYLLSGDLIAGRIKRVKNSSGESSIKKSYYHLDHLNSTKIVTDEQGDVEIRYEYRAFGDQLDRTGDSAKYSYSGKEFDDENNLYYFNQRYYDPNLGRFINLDPIQDGSNWYLYCSNNPLNMVDPTGLSHISDLSTTKNFVDKRDAYIDKYQNISLREGTVINEKGISDGNTAEHKERTMSKGTLGNLFVSDYTAKVGTPIYTGRVNTFKTDSLRWSYGDSTVLKNQEGDVIRVGQGYGRRIVSEAYINGDKQQLVYAHLNNNAQVDRDFFELQHAALTAKKETFTLPEKVQIGEVGMTGTTTGPHLHYERNQIPD